MAIWKTKENQVLGCKKIGRYYGALNPGSPTKRYLDVYEDPLNKGYFILSTNDYKFYTKVYLRKNNPEIQLLPS